MEGLFLRSLIFNPSQKWAVLTQPWIIFGVLVSYEIWDHKLSINKNLFPQNRSFFIRQPFQKCIVFLRHPVHLVLQVGITIIKIDEYTALVITQSDILYYCYLYIYSSLYNRKYFPVNIICWFELVLPLVYVIIYLFNCILYFAQYWSYVNWNSPHTAV